MSARALPWMALEPQPGRLATGTASFSSAWFLRWVSSFDRSSFGYFVSAWFDTGNGLCEASESPVQWSVFNNFDLTDPLVIEVTPGTSQEAPCP